MNSSYCILLSAFLLYLPPATAQLSQKPESTSIPYRSPIKGEIGSAIRREMEKARRGDLNVDDAGIAERMDEAFPYLDDYVNDPNDNVQLEIVSILSRETSERSLRLTTRYLKPGSAAFSNGCRWIYNRYTQEQIQSWGGVDLQRALFMGAREDPRPQAIVLLSCFGPSARSQVNEIRKLYRMATVRFEIGFPDAPITFYCDLTLSQTEDAGGLAQLKQRLSMGDLGDVATLLAASKFLSAKPLIGLMVDSLKDKRPFFTYRYAPDRPTFPIRYTRICDIAWAALHYKMGDARWLDVNPGPQTEEALQTVEAQVKARFALSL